MYSIIIKDKFNKELIWKFKAETREGAVGIVKNGLAHFMNPRSNDRIVWSYLNEDDPNEKDAPRLAFIVTKHGDELDIFALIYKRP